MRKQTGSVLVGFLLVLIILNAWPSSAATVVTVSEGETRFELPADTGDWR